MDKIREQLIEDIINYLQETPIALTNSKAIEIQNTITQIIVDTFDELEYK